MKQSSVIKVSYLRTVMPTEQANANSLSASNLKCAYVHILTICGYNMYIWETI